jgi:DNA polymerase III subunit delta'
LSNSDLRLSEIVGQSAAIKLLLQAARKKQPSHAYLFHGPEGVGKAVAARAFAGALMCLLPSPEGEACGQCASCHKLASGTHPDFRLVGIQREGAGGSKWEISIDQIRQNRKKPRATPAPLLVDAYYPPIVSPWKVYVIDPADSLSNDAGGALLKLLEEPPPYVVIILVTSRPGMILATLRSRCWAVGFRLVAREAIQQSLAALDCPPEPARLFAALADGRIGWAIKNCRRQEIEEARRRVIELLCRLPNLPHEETLSFAENLREIALDCFGGTDGEEAAEAEEAPARGLEGERALRISLPPVLDLAVSWFRDLLLSSQQAEELITNNDYRELLSDLSRRLPRETCRKSIVALLETKRLTGRYVNVSLATEALAIRLRREAG